MKRVILAALITCLCVFSSPPSIRTTEDELQVSGNLSGPVADIEHRELILIFSADMVPLGGNRPGAEIVSLAPAVAGDFYWRGTKTLAFKPKTRFAYSTRYRVTIPSGIKSLGTQEIKKTVQWEFTTPLAFPTEFRTASGRYFSSFSNQEKLITPVWVQDDLYIRFAQPVLSAQLSKFLKVSRLENQQDVPFRLWPVESNQVRLQWLKPLLRQSLYRIKLKAGFPGRRGIGEPIATSMLISRPRLASASAARRGS